MMCAQLLCGTCAGNELVTAYREALGSLGVGTFDMGAPRAYHSAFAAMAAEASGELAAT